MSGGFNPVSKVLKLGNAEEREQTEFVSGCGLPDSIYFSRSINLFANFMISFFFTAKNYLLLSYLLWKFYALRLTFWTWMVLYFSE